MELFIQVRDGQPFEHPIFFDNFRAAFPDVDVDNLPPEFARFERVEPPVVGVHEVYEGVTYERDGAIFKDVHHVRQMTGEEKLTKNEQIPVQWAQTGLASWRFDEATGSFKPPVDPPQDGRFYRWDEATVSWVEAPSA